jgi:hypothetical protein
MISIFQSLSEIFPSVLEGLLSPTSGCKLHKWPMTQHFLNGLRPNELTLLCAPTGAGKTALLANISAQLLSQSIPHFVAPVETGGVDYATRVVSVLYGKDLNNTEKISFTEAQRISDSITPMIKNELLFISPHDNRVPVDEMIATLMFMCQEKKCQVALLDNLNFFLDVVSSQMEKAEMDNAIHEFVMLVKKIPMHIILVVHPKKTDDGRVVSEFDIKGSSTAVQECANIILFNRPLKKEIDDYTREWSDRELVFKKIRKRGMFVNKPIWFKFENGKYFEYVS